MCSIMIEVAPYRSEFCDMGRPVYIRSLRCGAQIIDKLLERNSYLSIINQF